MQKLEIREPGDVVEAGPLRYRIGPAGIGKIWWEDVEIVRSIFVTVRDINWREVAPTWFEATAQGASTQFSVRHQSRDIDFTWHGCLDASDPLRPTFAISGVAHTSFQTSRLGLVILHPVDPLIGCVMVCDGPGGIHRQTIGDLIYPQRRVDGGLKAMTPPFTDLELARSDFGTVKFHLTGDLFEMEDQRNWCDASFKTYCTPLALPCPRTISTGTTITSTAEVHLAPAKGSPVGHVPAGTITLSNKVAARAFPVIGTVVAASHGSVDWPVLSMAANDEVARRHLESLKERRGTLPLLEIAMRPTRLQAIHSESLRFILGHRDRVSRILLRGEGVDLPTAADLSAVRSLLPGLEERIFAATTGYFAELQREVTFDLEVAGVAFPICPTVHRDDEWTLADNAAGLSYMIRSARSITGKEQVVASPLGISYPERYRDGFPPDLIAPWILASLANATQAGPTSIIFAQDVVEVLQLSHEGTALLRRLARSVDAKLLEISTDLPEDIFAFALAGEAGFAEVFIANVGGVPARIALKSRSVEHDAMLLAAHSFRCVDVELGPSQ